MWTLDFHFLIEMVALARFFLVSEDGVIGFIEKTNDNNTENVSFSSYSLLKLDQKTVMVVNHFSLLHMSWPQAKQ